MCGIAGVWQLDGSPVAPELLESMCSVLEHRGPDAHGVKTLGPVGLAHTRLAILDLSDAGRQPMADPDERVWLTFNGEVYNFLELRAELEMRGHTFVSRTDTEVLIHLYMEYGERFLERLHGMFALALWDVEQRKLLLARDRVGQKPLYLHVAEGHRIVFGSEIKALLQHDGLSREIDPRGLADFMTYGFVPEPHTIFRDIVKLEPGHAAVFSPEGRREFAYWELAPADVTAASEGEWCEGLIDRLRTAVVDRQIADVPLGAFLSGGIDSSAVVAMMQGDVVTSSIGFAEEGYDETRYARMVVERFGTTHHEDVVEYGRFEEILDTLLWHFEEPFCDESAIAVYYLSKLSRKHVTVALSGDGGDEAFGGYEKYARLLAERRRAPAGSLLGWTLPAFRSASLGAISPQFARAANFLESAAASPAEAIHLANAHLRDHEARSLYSARLTSQLQGYRPFELVERHYDAAPDGDFLSKVLHVDTKFLLPGDFLVKVDRMSMANSLEVRSPFLDHRLLEFAAAVPSSLKIKGEEKKYVLKKALEPHLPHEVLYRKKMGFEVPIVRWFATSLAPFVERELIEDPGAVAEWFEMDTVRRIWREFQGGRRGHKSLLWNLLMFKLWHRKWADVR